MSRKIFLLVFCFIFMLVFPARLPAGEHDDIAGLLKQNKIEVEMSGAGIRWVQLKVRRVYPDVTSLFIPVGTFFGAEDASVQNMIATADVTSGFENNDWQTVAVPVACANYNRAVPKTSDAFTLQEPPQVLRKLAPVLGRTKVSADAKQAAVWIIADDANSYELSGIRAGDIILALQMCDQAGYDITDRLIWGWASTYILEHFPESPLRDWLKDAVVRLEYKTLTNAGVENRWSNRKTAVENFDQAIALNPEYARAYFERGLVKRELDQADDALDDFTRAIALDPEYTEAYYQRGEVYIWLGQSERAAPDLTRVIERDPQRVKAYFLRGLTRIRAKEYDRAIEDYTAMLRIDPDNTPAYHDRAYCWQSKGEFTRALEDYSRAIAIEPRVRYFHHSRGRLYADMKDYDKAIEDFNTAQDLGAGSYIYYDLGKAFFEKGDCDQAVAAFNNFLKWPGAELQDVEDARQKAQQCEGR